MTLREACWKRMREGVSFATAQMADIVSSYARGDAARVVGERFGISASRVQQIAEKYVFGRYTRSAGNFDKLRRVP